MPGPIAEAFVEIRPDVSRFPTELKSSVNAAFKSVEASAAEVGKAIEDEFKVSADESGHQLLGIGGDAREAANIVDREFAGATRSVRENLGDVATAAERVGVQMQLAFTTAGDEADAQIRQIGGTAFIPVTEGAINSAAAVSAAFREAANVSDTELRTIGGANAFAPLAASAEAASVATRASVAKATTDINARLRDTNGRFAGMGTAGQQSAQTIGSSFSRFAIPALLGTGAALAAIGGALAGFGLKGAANLEQTQIGFTALLGSAQDAQTFIQQMFDFAARTPFQFEGLADTAKRFLAISDSIGITRDQILPTIAVLGDLTSVLGAPQEALNQVVLAIGQIGSKGRVQTQELLQIAQALPGFAPLKALADGLGVTTAQAQAMVEQGLIPAQQGVALLIQGMAKFPGAAGAMQKQSQTLSGLFSTLHDVVQITLIQAFQPLVVALKDLIPNATNILGGAIQALAPPLTKLIINFLPILTSLLQNLAPIIGQIFDAFGNLAQAVGGPLGLAFQAILKAVTPVLELLGNAASTLLPPLISIFTSLLTAVTPIINVLAQFGQQLVTALLPVINAVVQAISDNQDVFTELAQAFAEMAQALIPLLPPLSELLVILIKDVGIPALILFVKEQTLLIRGFAAVARFLTPILVPAFHALAIAIETVHDFIAATGKAIGDNFLPVVQTVGGFIQDKLLPPLQTIGDIVKTVVVDAFKVLAAITVGPVVLAFRALQDVGSFLIDNVFGPIGTFVTSVLVPAFKILATVTAVLLVGPFVAMIGIGVALLNTVLIPIGSALMSVLVPAFQALGTIAAVAWNLLWTAVQTAWTTIGVPVFDAIKTIIDGLVTIWEQDWAAIQAIYTTVWNILDTVWNTIGVPTFNAIFTFLGILADTWSTVWGGLTSVVSSVWDTIKNIVSTSVLAVVGFVQSIAAPILDAASTMWDPISTFFGSMISVIKSVYNSFARFWNNVQVDLPKVHIPGTDIDFGGQTFGLPDLPIFSKKGAFLGDIPESVGVPAILHGGETVIPADLSKFLMKAAQAGTSGAGASVTFAPGSIVVPISGTVTPAQAHDIGESLGDGIIDKLIRRSIIVSTRAS